MNLINLLFKFNFNLIILFKQLILNDEIIINIKNYIFYSTEGASEILLTIGPDNLLTLPSIFLFLLRYI